MKTCPHCKKKGISSLDWALSALSKHNNEVLCRICSGSSYLPAIYLLALAPIVFMPSIAVFEFIDCSDPWLLTITITMGMIIGSMAAALIPAHKVKNAGQEKQPK